VLKTYSEYRSALAGHGFNILHHTRDLKEIHSTRGTKIKKEQKQKAEKRNNTPFGCTVEEVSQPSVPMNGRKKDLYPL